MSTWGEKLVKRIQKAQEFVDAHTDDLKKAGDVVEAKAKEAFEGAKTAFEEVKNEIRKAASDSAAPEEKKAEDAPKECDKKGHGADHDHNHGHGHGCCHKKPQQGPQ